MRVGITGASSTGKTALAHALSDILSIPVAEEGAREAAAALGLRHSGHLHPGNALEFQKLVLQIKIK